MVINPVKEIRRTNETKTPSRLICPVMSGFLIKGSNGELAPVYCYERCCAWWDADLDNCNFNLISIELTHFVQELKRLRGF